MTSVRWWGVLSAAFALSGCATQIGPGQVDGGGNDVAAMSDGSIDAHPDAGTFCTLPNGGTCPAGTNCPAGDGCNSCSCPATGGPAACTLLACAPPDVIDADAHASGPCNCAPDQICGYDRPGCGMAAQCFWPDYCTRDAGGQFCGCDGVTFTASGSCPSRPYAFAGPCEAIDAGSCAGAGIGPGGGCQGPDDGALPVECCFGYDCDPRDVRCNSAPPDCAAGTTPAISPMGCYTLQCVPDSHCAVIYCSSDTACPQGWTCTGGVCAAPTP